MKLRNMMFLTLLAPLAIIPVTYSADAIAQTPGGSKPATDNAQAKKRAGNNAAKVTEANKAGKATENNKSLKVTETGKSAAPKK